MVFCADLIRSALKYGKRGAELYAIQDATIAASFAMLSATNLGLSSCWVGGFDENEVKKILNIKSKYLIPIAILAIGYGDEDPERARRRNLKDLVEFI